MNAPVLLYFAALIFALIDELRARGQSLTSWAAAFIALGLLWGFFKL